MARKALLTVSQCNKARTLYQGGARAIELAQKYGVSESSMYKVLDGTYQARPDESKAPLQVLPIVPAHKPMGITPSLFDSTARAQGVEPHPMLASLLEKAAHIDDTELDEVTVAAAELIVAKARLNRAIAHVH